MKGLVSRLSGSLGPTSPVVTSASPTIPALGSENALMRRFEEEVIKEDHWVVQLFEEDLMAHEALQSKLEVVCKTNAELAKNLEQIDTTRLELALELEQIVEKSHQTIDRLEKVRIALGRAQKQSQSLFNAVVSSMTSLTQLKEIPGLSDPEKNLIAATIARDQEILGEEKKHVVDAEASLEDKEFALSHSLGSMTQREAEIYQEMKVLEARKKGLVDSFKELLAEETKLREELSKRSGWYNDVQTYRRLLKEFQDLLVDRVESSKTRSDSFFSHREISRILETSRIPGLVVACECVFGFFPHYQTSSESFPYSSNCLIVSSEDVMNGAIKESTPSLNILFKDCISDLKHDTISQENVPHQVEFQASLEILKSFWEGCEVFPGVRRFAEKYFLSNFQVEGNSTLLSILDFRQVLEQCPKRCWLDSWKRIYNLNEDGMSMHRFLQLTAESKYSIVIIKDSGNSVFGFFCPVPFHINKIHIGTPETFVFKCDPSFQCFAWSRKNSFFIICHVDSLAVGGGSHFAIHWDSDLRNGSSGFCETIDSPCLSSTSMFLIQGLEVWGVVGD